MTEDDSSALSSPPSEDDLDLQLTKKDGILKFLSTAPRDTSPPPKREASPPHEYVLADNPDIAVCVSIYNRVAWYLYACKTRAFCLDHG